MTDRPNNQPTNQPNKQTNKTTNKQTTERTNKQAIKQHGRLLGWADARLMLRNVAEKQNFKSWLWGGNAYHLYRLGI